MEDKTTTTVEPERAAEEEHPTGYIERWSTEAIPVEHRHGRPWHLFIERFSPGLSLLQLMVGALLSLLGLSLTQIITAALVGTIVSMMVTGVIAAGSAKAHVPTSTLGRGLTSIGSIVSNMTSWLFSVAVATAGIVVITSTTVSVLHAADIPDGPPVKLLVALAVTVLSSMVALAGKNAILLSRMIFSVLALACGAAILPIVLMKTATLHTPGGSPLTLLTGIAVVAVMTGLAWLHNGGDLARYQKKESTGTTISLTALGGSIGSILIVIGAVITPSTESSPLTPLYIMLKHVPRWSFFIFFICAAISMLGFVTSNLYGAGLTAIDIGVPLNRIHATLLGIGSTTVLATIVLLAPSQSILVLLSALLVLLIPLAAWAGIVAVSVLLSGSEDKIRMPSLLIAVLSGWALLGISPSTKEGFWGFVVAASFGVSIALAIGLLGGLANHAMGRNTHSEDNSTRAPKGPAHALGQSYEEAPLSRGDLLAARPDVSADRMAAEIEAILAPQPQRSSGTDDPAEHPQWHEDHSRGLAGVFRPSYFDETQRQIANEPRPSRAMSAKEQDELEEMLTATGTMHLHIDDGSIDSPAKPRRKSVEE